MSIAHRFLTKNKDGYGIKRLLDYIHPYRMGFDQFQSPYPYAVAASGSNTKPAAFTSPNNAATGITNLYGTPLEIKQIIFADSTDLTASADFTAYLANFADRNFMNNPVHIRALAGTAKNPAWLYEPIYMMSNESLSCQLNKLSGGASTMRMYLDAIQYHPDSAPAGSMERDFLNRRMMQWSERRKYVYPFWMTTDQSVSLAGNATTNFVNKNAECHLELFNLMAVSTGNFAFELVEVVSGQSIMNGQVTRTNSIGDAQFPAIFPVSYTVKEGARMRFTFTDLSGSTNNIFIALQGRKIVNVPWKNVPDVLRDTHVDEIITAADKFNIMPAEKYGVI